MRKDLKGKEIGKGIRQRDSKLYEARSNVNGVEIYLTNTNLATLKKDFRQAIKEVKLNNLSVAKAYTLDQWYKEWFECYKSVQVKKSSALVLRRKYARIFGNYIGNKNIKEILNIDIQSCITRYTKTKKDLDVLKSTLCNLKECFDVAIANKVVKSNPCVVVTVASYDFYKANIEDNYYLTKREVDIFLKEAEGDWYYELFYIMANTGMRVSELCGLQWKDIDFVNGYIYIRRQLICSYYKGKDMYYDNPKTPKSVRKIPMIRNVANVLQSQRQKIADRKEKLGLRWRLQYLEDEKLYEDSVFFTTMGSPLTKDAVERATTAVTKRIQKYTMFKKVHPHMFRHAFTMECFDNDIEPKAIQTVLGHMSVAFTMDVYNHIADTSMTNVFDKLNDTQCQSDANNTK